MDEQFDEIKIDVACKELTLDERCYRCWEMKDDLAYPGWDGPFYEYKPIHDCDCRDGWSLTHTGNMLKAFFRRHF